tara:strand:+ start:197 stop:547 length:351 start_codon:yes stop_codon:yes gene_type:complete
MIKNNSYLWRWKLIVNKNKVNKQIDLLEEKENEILIRLKQSIKTFGKEVGFDVTDDMVEQLQGIMNVNSIHRDINREKTLLILKKSFTLKILFMIYVGWVVNGFKRLFKIKTMELR